MTDIPRVGRDARSPDCLCLGQGSGKGSCGQGVSAIKDTGC